MNTYNINDESFKKTETYINFINNNPGSGYLKIRAYAASQAIPIILEVTVSKIIDNNRIIFYDGNTNSSGIIEKITLPTPKIDPDNMSAPTSITYEVTAKYNDYINTYVVNMYENIYVIQTINVVPNNNLGGI